jgi:hypothetical protein
MSKKIQQHYIPRVYLKQFQIDAAENKSFVYCIDFSNKYNPKPQRKGINDKIFKKEKYYNDQRLADPYAIEDALSVKFESKYERIVNAISEEKSPPKEIVEDLMTWLYISKMRSPIHRANTQRFLEWFIDTNNKYRGRVPTENEKLILQQYINQKSKNVHLGTLSEIKRIEKLFSLYVNTLNAKHWKFLISQPDLPFLTNDNPGFSPNLQPLSARNFPFHQVMELNSHSTIYYVLTPKYCIEITPFTQETPLNICALNMEMIFEQAPRALIDFINKGVFYSKYKLLISNSLKPLEDFIRMK